MNRRFMVLTAARSAMLAQFGNAEVKIDVGADVTSVYLDELPTPPKGFSGIPDLYENKPNRRERRADAKYERKRKK